MEEIALGMLSLSVLEFEDITPRELINKITGHERMIESQQRLNWEIARWQALQIIAPPQKRQIRAIDLIKFPWEEAPIKTEEEKEKDLNRAREKEQQWKKGSKPKAKL
jgi:hypothetical protein